MVPLVGGVTGGLAGVKSSGSPERLGENKHYLLISLEHWLLS